jgi:FG-GAP-like repeat/PQQ-like domain
MRTFRCGARLLCLLTTVGLLTVESLYAQQCVAPALKSVSVDSTGGVEPREMALGEFEHDGLLDVAVVNLSSNDVAIMRNGGGSFSTALILPFPSAVDVAVGDFNHDGWDDIAVASGTAKEVYVRLADRTGGFDPFTSYTVGNGPIEVNVGDYNHDGDLDIATYNSTDKSIVVLKGDGAGGFSVLAPVSGMSGVVQMATGDVNHDDYLDIVAVDDTGNQIWVMIGDGSGGFAPVTSYPSTGAGPAGLVLGDFNGDGLVDVVTADGGSKEAELFRGDGSGAFSSVGTFPAGGGVYARVAAGDLDRDGDLDLVLPDKGGARIAVLLGNGGVFDNGVDVPGDSEGLDAIIADFDHDGRNDAVVSRLLNDKIELYANDLGVPCPNPSFGLNGKLLPVGSNPVAITRGDYDGDGNLDFVTANQSSNDLSRWRGTGNGDFVNLATFPTGGAPVSADSGDFDSDGDLDVVSASSAATRLVLHLNSAGNLGAGPSIGLSGTPVQVVAADVSFDGKIDLVVSLQFNNVLVFRNDGTGAFPTAQTYFVGASPGAVAVGDLDNDLLPDIAVAEASNQIVFFQNLGAGLFTPKGFLTLSSRPTALKIADMNGDGNRDLIVTLASGNLQTHLGNGSFVFSPAANVAIVGPASINGLVVADLNLDGKLDVAVGTVNNPRVIVALGTGSGTFATPLRNVITKEAPSAVSTGDYDRDGFPDLLVAEPTGNEVMALMGDGQGSFAPRFYGPASTSADSRGFAFGDFDRDGKLDVALANAGTDDVSILLGQGGGAFTGPANVPITPSRAPVWVTAADIIQNGRLDLLVSAQSTKEIVFMRGTGTGSFGSLVRTSTLGVPYISRVVDFDFNGNLDALVLADTNVEVYKGDGNGGFTFMSAYPLGGTGSGLVIGDFDRDGLIDFAATQTNDSTLHLFLGTAPGTWASGQQVSVQSTPRDFDTADLNGDGYLDFAVPLETSNRVGVVLSNGPGTYDPAVLIGAPSAPRSLRMLDMNGDGNMDLVVASGNDHVLAYYTGNGAGGFSAPVLRTVGARIPAWLQVGDVDADGRPDVGVVPETTAGTSPPGIAIVLNTNCKARQMRLDNDVSSCDLPGSPFVSQPALSLFDDGDNPLKCELNPVLASIRSGTGTAGAVLLGTTSLVPSSGSVGYTDLAVDRAGGGYQLQFALSGASKKLSRTFSQGLSPLITGPASVCQGDPALYDAGPGYDTYGWTLDSTPMSMAQQVDLTTNLTPGIRHLDLDVVRDTCTATTFLDIDVFSSLTGVGVTPTGPVSVCVNCTGPTALATPVGGGTVTYQWGYRTSPPGAIIPLAGEINPSYAIEGQDFPGTGTYYLVVTATPTCGTVQVSTNVQIDVGAATALEPLAAFTALSTTGQNILEYATPPASPCVAIRILRNTSGFPTDPMDTIGNVWVSGGDLACPALNKGAFPDTVGVVDTTTYYYSAFVSDGVDFSLRKSVKGRPFDSTGKIKWAYNTGATAMAQAGLRIKSGIASVYIVSNDSLVHGIEPGPGGGQWLTSAIPFPLGLPSQTRPPAVPFSVGGGPVAPNGAVFVTSQDGNVYALDGDSLSQVWSSNAGEMITAAAAGIFSGFGGSPNDIFVGTRNTIAPNGLRAFNVDSGAQQWTFDDSVPQGGDGTPLGVVLGGASVDYPGDRVFFGSRKAAGGNATIWAVDVSGASPSLLWKRDIGDVDGSPVYLLGSPTRLVVGSNAQKVDLLDADSGGSSLWLAPYTTGDGNVKGFVFPHAHTGTQYFMFSTLNDVTSIQDNGTGTAPTMHWKITDIPSPSIPLALPGTTSALVGGGDGKLYQVNAIDTASPTKVFLVLGDGSAPVGAPTFDITTGLVYVGSADGVIYAVEYPLP